MARFWDGKQWTEATLPSQYTPPELVVPRPEATSAPTSQPQVYMPAKNPGIAVLLSFFLPGGGNLYAGSTAAGVVLLICWFVSWLFMLAAMPVFLIVWIVGMATAYGAAVKFNQRNGVSVR